MLAMFCLAACKKDETKVSGPTDISNVTAKSIVGGAVVKWTLPKDSNFLYLEVRYEKKGKIITTNVSKYTDSLVINGLLNKYQYKFEVQAFNASKTDKIGGAILTTNTITPIKRGINTVYSKLPVTNSMIETYTQETSEGPKSNLVDGDKATYWHSAWSANVQPLPHWVTIAFPTETELSQIRYYFRQNTTLTGRPTQIGLDTSTDGTNYTRVWTSASGLPIGTGLVSTENTLQLDKTYKAKYFKVLILAASGNPTFTTLGDMSFYTAILTDLELAAEQSY